MAHIAGAFRCGWRVIRHPPFDRFGDSFVDVQRGTWRYRMDTNSFGLMPDEYFANLMTRAYRESVFEQLQQDLNTLGRFLADTGGYWGSLMTDGMPADVREALERYEATKKDIQA